MLVLFYGQVSLCAHDRLWKICCLYTIQILKDTYKNNLYPFQAIENFKTKINI